MEYKLRNYFWKLEYWKWDGKAWVGSRVYLVYLEIFWEFFYTRKMYLSVYTSRVAIVFSSVVFGVDGTGV
jgi:hypothetical protein